MAIARVFKSTPPTPSHPTPPLRSPPPYLTTQKGELLRRDNTVRGVGLSLPRRPLLPRVRLSRAGLRSVLRIEGEEARPECPEASAGGHLQGRLQGLQGVLPYGARVGIGDRSAGRAEGERVGARDGTAQRERCYGVELRKGRRRRRQRRLS